MARSCWNIQVLRREHVILRKIYVTDNIKYKVCDINMMYMYKYKYETNVRYKIHNYIYVCEIRITFPPTYI